MTRQQSERKLLAVWARAVENRRESIPCRFRLQRGREMRWQPENYRDTLKLMAQRLCLDRRLKRRFDSSDLVQQSLVKALQNIDQFQGQEEPQFLRWLHAILVNTARDQLDRDRAAKRNRDQEISLEGAV